MIQDAMRKHRRLMLGILLVLIIGPFVLWGGSFSQGLSDEANRGTAVVAVVAERPITVEEFRDALNMERQRRAQFGQPATAQQMLSDGTATRVLDDLTNRQIISHAAEKGKYRFDREYLVEKLKENPAFQNEEGKFDPKRWNELVERTTNWNAIYSDIASMEARRLVIERATASARVLDEELRKQFEADNTSIELKYLAIEPKVEPTEKQIKETYDANPSAYDLPEKRKAEYVALSLKPAKPALADELVQKARAGEDFAELAKTHSTAPSKDNGGDLGWISQGPITRPHQQPVFALNKGDVSEPIYGPNGYYIYKVEDERTDPVSNQRELKAREILVNAVLDEAALKAVQDKANQIQAKAKETGDLRAAAAEAGLEVQTTGEFSIESLNIDNVPDADARFLRSRLATVGAGEIADVFEAQENMYVAKVTEVVPPQPQPLEAVREKVVQDTIARLKAAPEYREKTQAIAKEVSGAKSLDEILAKYPDLGPVEALPAFTAKTYDFKGPMWNPRDVVAAVASKEPGALVGPVQDFTGKAYFVELVSKQGPDEKTWAEVWPKELEELRKQALAQEQNKRLTDYLAYMRETLLDDGEYNIDQGAFIQALGLGQPAETQQPEGTGTPVTADTAPATDGEPAPASESEQPAATAAPDAPAVSSSEPPQAIPAEEAPAPTPATTPAEVPPAPTTPAP